MNLFGLGYLGWNGIPQWLRFYKNEFNYQGSQRIIPSELLCHFGYPVND